MIVCDGISRRYKRIINSKILEEIIKDKAKEVYDEEKKRNKKK